MQIWRVPYKLRVREAGGPKRSEGLHLSSVIRDLALRGHILDKKFAGEIDPPAERVELGIAWEERLSKHHPEICFHPGEVKVDGISMSIDGASFLSGDTSIFHPATKALVLPQDKILMPEVLPPVGKIPHALHEFKLTWKSSRHDIEDHWMWLTQIKSYLHGLSVESKEKWRIAYLHVFWVNGNYRRDDSDPESGPTYAIWGLQFSDLEIKENWDMIRLHRDRMVLPQTRVRLKFDQGEQ